MRSGRYGAFMRASLHFVPRRARTPPCRTVVLHPTSAASRRSISARSPVGRHLSPIRRRRSPPIRLSPPASPISPAGGLRFVAPAAADHSRRCASWPLATGGRRLSAISCRACAARNAGRRRRRSISSQTRPMAPRETPAAMVRGYGSPDRGETSRVSAAAKAGPLGLTRSLQNSVEPVSP